MYACFTRAIHDQEAGQRAGYLRLAIGQQHESEIEKDVRVERAMYANHFPTNGPTNNSRPMQQSNQSKKTNM